MRVFIVTQSDPFYIPIFFKILFEEVEEEVEVVTVFCLEPFDEPITALIKRMYELYGPVNFLHRGVDFMMRKASDAIGVGEYSVEAVVRSSGSQTEAIESVNTQSFVERVHDENIAVVLSVSAPEIFGSSVLAAPSWGCLNVHTAKLPKYRGMLPTFWALYHGDEEIGVTVHTMEEEIDQGQIAMQTTFPVASSDTLDDVIKRGKREGGRLAGQVLNALAEDGLQLRPMEGEGSYFSFPSAKERRELQRKGRRLL